MVLEDREDSLEMHGAKRGGGSGDMQVVEISEHKTPKPDTMRTMHNTSTTKIQGAMPRAKGSA